MGTKKLTPFTTPGFSFKIEPDDGQWLVTVGTRFGPISRRFERTSDSYRWLSEIWTAERAVSAARA